MALTTSLILALSSATLTLTERGISISMWLTSFWSFWL
jgi:hypothetical protein